MDPHAVLGVSPDASDEELARAYRELAKRHHPDRAGADTDAAARMQRVNEAYAAVRATRRRRGGTPGPPARRAPGWWLGDDVRARLGVELVGALDELERVLAVVWAASGDSHEVRLAVTDQRLLWLRDDAVAERVRWLRLGEVETADLRLSRVRRRGRLRIAARTRRRALRFAEIAPGPWADLASALEHALPTGVVRRAPGRLR